MAEVLRATQQALEVLLTANQLKRRWGGCSDMLLWRRLRDDPLMPQPLFMHGRRLWYLREIVAYERQLRTPEVSDVTPRT
jgi:hypothetical protein